MADIRIVKVRWVKAYEKAHNHLAIGVVIRETPHYIELKCRTVHFGQWQMSLKGVRQGAVATRMIPWNRIEVMHLLPDGTDWEADIALDTSGNIILNNAHKTPIADQAVKAVDR